MTLISCSRGITIPNPGSSSSPTDPDGEPVDNPPVGVVDDEAGFYVRNVENEDYSYNTHRGSTDFDTPCTAESGESVSCYMDARELDLYFHGVTLQYNVPSTLCSYVEVIPYWYIKYEVGAAPTEVHIDTDSLGNVGYDSNADGTIDGATESCDYNYTAEEGPNCCEGKYNQTSRTWSATLGNYDPALTTTTRGIPWGGSASSCFGGPAITTQSKDKLGVPKSSMYYVAGTGINNTYDVTAPINMNFLNNIYVSNFFELGDLGGAFPMGLRPATTSVTTYTPSRYYQFRCYDRAEELVSEISLSIREWNSNTAYDDRKNTPTGHGTTGAEPSPWNSNDDYNDRVDWKDFTTNFPGLDLIAVEDL